MTNNNSPCREPLILKPVGKDYLWGGNRLNKEFDKGIDLVPLAETWECSVHPAGLSIIDSGAYKGKTLLWLLQAHPELLGTHPANPGELPILIKLIDAEKNLSVQVHPDDAYALEYENGQMGKTEMWYVLHADEGATLIYGLNCSVDKTTMRQSIQNGTIEKYLQKIPVKKNDVFFIRAGVVHAIGKGTLIAEIQQSSDLTYRLYDFDRVDKNGMKRELHIDKALAVADLRAANTPAQPMRVLQYRAGNAIELLCRCEYFQVERMLIHTVQMNKKVNFSTDSLSFQVLLCIEGNGSLQYNGKELIFQKGTCIFIPSGLGGIEVTGSAELLKVRC